MKSNLYWINGLSGAGKTTIASLFHSYLLDIKNNVVYLDGDILRGIILAAGRCSRMGDLTNHFPKCRTVLHGKELIQWQLDAMKGSSIKEISIVRGYLSETYGLK